jgi:hypothetical protein
MMVTHVRAHRRRTEHGTTNVVSHERRRDREYYEIQDSLKKLRRLFR